ncbi:MAG: hypothetical protein S4CHLAM2_06030 [Chlamydiales bacterium]|nr:hypothetical protein [Chlamydiales bacterium]
MTLIPTPTPENQSARITPAHCVQSCATSKATISLAAITSVAAIIIGALALSGVAPFAAALGTVGGAALASSGIALLLLAGTAASAVCTRKPASADKPPPTHHVASQQDVTEMGALLAQIRADQTDDDCNSSNRTVPTANTIIVQQKEDDADR